jgi:putative transposase
LPLKKKETSLKKLRESKRLVEIIAFCLMPNHFHLLLKQLQKKGTSTFMRNFQNSYARYFNTKYHRSGALFQALFKAVRIETDAQLLHVSRYIHLNLVSSFLVEIKNLENYPWSSFPEYMKSRSLEFVDPDLVLKQFKTEKDYKKFVFDQADYQRKLQEIKHLTLEKR